MKLYIVEVFIGDRGGHYSLTHIFAADCREEAKKMAEDKFSKDLRPRVKRELTLPKTKGYVGNVC